MPDFYDTVSDAKATVQSSYFGPGTYVVRIVGWRKTKNRNGRPFAALETVILSSDDHERHPVGSSASWLQMLDQDMAAPNIKATIMGLLGLNSSVPEDIARVTRDVVKACITDDDNPEDRARPSKLVGVLADVTATGITTREGKPFTKVAFKYRDPAEPVPVLVHRQRAAEEVAAGEAPPF